MSYARNQEDRMEKKMRQVGFELVEESGRRRKRKADKIMKHPDTGLKLTLDHKSTRGKESIRIQKADLDKVRIEADSDSIPAITFSFLDSPQVYIIFRIDDLEGVVY